MSADFSARRLAKALIRQLRTPRGARILHIGCGRGEVVGLLRRASIEAFGLFDGPTPEQSESDTVPELQPATLHQSIPFMAQSFDLVLVQQTADYDLQLTSPEACTATANLLAVLKPGGQFIYAGEASFSEMQEHLDQFPGEGRTLSLGTAGLTQFVLRLCGLAKPGLPSLKFTIPSDSVSRLEWHRIARTAVANLNRPAADETDSSSTDVRDSPAA